jgi:excisionase family DNA binding protein
MQKSNQVLQWKSLADDPLMRLSEVANALNVSRDTVRRWARLGKLPAVKLGGPHGFYKVRRSRVLALLGNESEVMNAENL